MLILNAKEVRQALPMKAAIEGMKSAYASLSSNRAEVPLRSRLNIPPQNASALFMPAFVQGDDEFALAVKVVTLFPSNPSHDLPFIHAGVLVMDPNNGQMLALLEGGTLTAIRTGAGAGAATDILSRPESKIAAIFGAGTQARTQLEAVCNVREIEKVWVYDPSPGKVEALITELSGKAPIPEHILAAQTTEEAAHEADIICTATTSHQPVFNHIDLKPGVHINGIGSYLPDMQEVPADTVSAARVVVDSRDACLAEAGDLIQPIQAGIFSEAHIYGELGEIVLGKIPGRTDVQQITFFKSVGIAVQDAVAAQIALKNAQANDLGQKATW